MVFVNRTETNPHTKIVLQHTSLNGGLWSNLLRKTAIKTTIYFPVEEESV